MFIEYETYNVVLYFQKSCLVSRIHEMRYEKELKKLVL